MDHVQSLSTHIKHVDRKSTRLNSSHRTISYAVFCLKKKKKNEVSRLCNFVRSLRSDSASLRYRRHPTLDPDSDRSGQVHPFVPKNSSFVASILTRLD